MFIFVYCDEFSIILRSFLKAWEGERTGKNKLLCPKSLGVILDWWNGGNKKDKRRRRRPTKSRLNVHLQVNGSHFGLQDRRKEKLPLWPSALLLDLGLKCFPASNASWNSVSSWAFVSPTLRGWNKSPFKKSMEPDKRFRPNKAGLFFFNKRPGGTSG